jgi:hypothetical protein
MSKKVLVIQYSQTGQLSSVLERVIAPLREAGDVEVTVENLVPVTPFPFPWGFFKFFDAFPETVYADVPPIQPLKADVQQRYDLVILGYQAWFLSPSMPVTAFLKSPEAASLLKDTPVVTVVACRDMWLMAQEQIRGYLSGLGARLVGHVALVDEAGTVGSFLATPIWVVFGSKGPHLGGLIPRAGVKPEQIQACTRFGDRMLERLRSGSVLDESLLRGLQAVNVNEGLISSERAIRRGFKVWGGLLRSLGPRGSWRRQPFLLVYFCWLVVAIIVLVPAGLILKRLLKPLLRKKIAEQKAYFAMPSGF